MFNLRDQASLPTRESEVRGLPRLTTKIVEIVDRIRTAVQTSLGGIRIVAAAGFLNTVYLRYFAKPAADRSLYSLIGRQKIHRIVELGVGDGVRSQRMIEMAQRHPKGEIRYAGIDLFEARAESQSGLSLKVAYRRLRASGAKVQLVPGDPFAALARTANSLTGTQLLIIAADQDEQSLARAWFYIPRMLTDDAQVFLQNAETLKFDRLTRADVEALAGHTNQRRRAA